jgi:hypothetical protein
MKKTATKKPIKLGKSTIRELGQDEIGTIGGGAVLLPLPPTLTRPVPVTRLDCPKPTTTIVPQSLARPCQTWICPLPTLEARCPVPGPTRTVLCPIAL